MKLSTLEIKGFKSFADKTVLHFNQNITGVVGPNGCGKSNVVDAIRWVLGEQKTSMLRLEKMDNLIFNGTKKRKASGLAEVSLTFENTKSVLATDFKNVCITRRLYRNGDSEYRLNDVPCRLKDITSLFLDTGVSADSYAIIELGMVDEILNDRDHSRRKLFEQASGISKYKKRKHETLLKLKGTENDLTRVEDLLFEIEGNLKSLEKQAKKAKKYIKLKENYKTKSIELAKVFLESYKQKLAQLNEQDNKTKNKKIAIEASISKLEANIQKQKLEFLDKEKALTDINKKLNEIIGGVHSQENDRNVFKEKISFEQEKNETAKKQIQLLNEKKVSLEQKLENIKSKELTQQNIVEKAKSEVDELATKKQEIYALHQSKKQLLDTDKENFQNIEKRFYEIEKTLAINKASKEKYEGDLFSFQEEINNKKQTFESLKK